MWVTSAGCLAEPSTAQHGMFACADMPVCVFVRSCMCPADAGHAADLARQAAHLSSLTDLVAEESKVNRELAGLLQERLESSKR